MQDFVKSRGRPQAEVTKDKVSIRLSPEVTEYFRSIGIGWQSKIDKILVDYVSGHNLKRMNQTNYVLKVLDLPV